MVIMTDRRPANRATMKDVAEAAGVSTALASFALNDRPGVSAERKRHILAIAESLGYRANPVAKELRTGASTLVGLIIRNLQNPFFLDLIAGAQEAAVDHGVTVLVMDSAYSAEREAMYLDELAARRVAGLAIAPVGPGAAIDRWQELRPDATTVVINAELRRRTGVTRVQPDNEAAVGLAVDHLAELGHRRIAFLSAPRDLMADHDRLRHFRKACAGHKITPDLIETPLESGPIYDAVRRRLTGTRRRPPTAIVTNSDFSAHAVYHAARDTGRRVGSDLSVIGHDDLSTADLLDPPLTTIRLDRRSMGAALFDRLLRPGLPDHYEPVELIIRASTGPPMPTGLALRQAQGT